MHKYHSKQQTTAKQSKTQPENAKSKTTVTATFRMYATMFLQ